MSVRIRYEGKGGKPETMVVGSQDLAERVAKSLKNATFEPCDADAPEVAVTTCPPAGAVEQLVASKAYYDRHWNPIAGEAGETSEQRAERRMEYVSQGRLYGGNVNDLLADLDG